MQSRPQLNSRISHNGCKGTIRYIGGVDGTIGTWLGVEWDDIARGKHDGAKDGIQYFTCRIPGTGSFIRPTVSVTYERSFLQALQSKYIESLQKATSKETVTLGSSNGAIEVEAVGLDRVRSKLAKLEKLREVSLDGEEIARSDPPETMRSVCPNIRGLNLSNNLLSSWSAVAQIASELPKLESLNLSQNYLTDLTQVIVTANLHTAFRSLLELSLNKTFLVWSEVVLLCSALPQLKSLEVGYNEYDQLALITAGGTLHPYNVLDKSQLETLNLDSNKLSEWVNIVYSLCIFPRLTRIILTSNKINSIPLPPNSIPQGENACPTGNGASIHSHPSCMLSVRHLGVQENLIANWEDMEGLGEWLPTLESLSINGNPLAEGYGDYRHPIIARISSLLVLDGSRVSNKERNDSELYYLSLASRDDAVTNEDRPKKYRQWQRLCEKHGYSQTTDSSPVHSSAYTDTKDGVSNSALSSFAGINTSTIAPRKVDQEGGFKGSRAISGRDTLSSRLITINVYLCESGSHTGYVPSDCASRDITNSAPSVTEFAHKQQRLSDQVPNLLDEGFAAAREVAQALKNIHGEQKTAATKHEPPYTHKFELKVLPTMTLRTFRLKLQKTIASLLSTRPLTHNGVQESEAPRDVDGRIGVSKSARPRGLLTPAVSADRTSEASSSLRHQQQQQQQQNVLSTNTQRPNQTPDTTNRSTQTLTRGQIPLSSELEIQPNVSSGPASVGNQTQHLVNHLSHQTQSLSEPRVRRPHPSSRSQLQLRAWLVMGPHSADGVSELDYTGTNDTRDLAWMGVEDGSDVVVRLGG